MPRAAVAFLVALVLTIPLAACAQSGEQSGKSSTTSGDGPSTKAEPPAKTEPAYLEDPNRPGDVAAELVGTEWVLVSLYGDDLLEHTNVTLNITDTGVAGFAGCNRHGGNATVNGGVFEARGGGDHTLVGCGGPRGEQEEAYFRALGTPGTYEISDGRLEVRDEAGEPILVYAAKEQRDMDPTALVGTEWRLDSADGYSPAGGFDSTLAFPSAGEFGSYDGCRSYAGTYFAEGDDIFFTSTGSEDGECMRPGYPGERYASVPGGGVGTGPADYVLSEGRLEISTEQGDEFVFVPLREGEEVRREGEPWVLEAFTEDGETTPVIAGTGITLRFDGDTLRPQGTISGSSGCNDYGAAYTHRDTNRTPPNAFLIEGAGGTEMACYDPAGIMEQERRYLDFLEDVRALHRYVEGGSSPRDGTPKLELTTNDGRELVFVAPPP